MEKLIYMAQITPRGYFEEIHLLMTSYDMKISRAFIHFKYLSSYIPLIRVAEKIGIFGT